MMLGMASNRVEAEGDLDFNCHHNQWQEIMGFFKIKNNENFWFPAQDFDKNLLPPKPIANSNLCISKDPNLTHC